MIVAQAVLALPIVTALTHRAAEDLWAAFGDALMDLGATLCTRAKPNCANCPLSASCVALATSNVAHLPTPPPKKTTPQRTTRMLILRYAGEILLQQRPPNGIWGGLWSLPETDMEADLAQHCRNHLGLEIALTARLSAFKHSFTHFRLHITPQLCDVTGLLPRVEQTQQLWLTPYQALSAPIPTPVRKVLHQLITLEAADDPATIQ